jgi:hypothetical protein
MPTIHLGQEKKKNIVFTFALAKQDVSTIFGSPYKPKRVLKINELR